MGLVIKRTKRSISSVEGGVSIWTDGTTSFRNQVRSGALCTDQTLTITGFSGSESIDDGLTGDWIELTSIKLP